MIRDFDVPSEEQLQRVAAFALFAWGDKVKIRYGFRVTQDGVVIYVKQAKRGGNVIEIEAVSANAACVAIEACLTTIISYATGHIPETIERRVEVILETRQD